MHSTSLFTNPYAIEVLRTKREELIEGINDPDHLLSCLIDSGLFSPEKRMVVNNDINALNSSNETMEYLISKGAKLDVMDQKGRTPLHRAAEKGQGDAAKVLLRCGAHMYSLDKEGKAPLHLAAQNNHSHILKVFLREEARSSANYNHPSIFKALLEYSKDIGTDINAYNEMQYTPLLLACETGKAECAEVLIEKGANLGIKTPASDTALHLAVRAGAASINNLLLHKGMEANVTNQADETPLHIAALHILTMHLLFPMNLILGI
uniref:Uncharacterized protein n=1 Tax=Pavo cristatus TaxID=9049 RepID=A0A8C9EVH7_PAVCR